MRPELDTCGINRVLDLILYGRGKGKKVTDEIAEAHFVRCCLSNYVNFHCSAKL
jgi:hypothetical protein